MEKSRHFRQDPWPGAADAAGTAALFVVPLAVVLGLDANNLERSGREDAGIGGGASDPGLASGTGGGLAVLLKPKDSADLLGAAGLTVLCSATL